MYIPILKHKAGELKALETLDETAGLELVKPLVEIFGSDDDGSPDSQRASTEALVEKAARNLTRAWRGDRPQPLLLDTSYAEPDPEEDGRRAPSVLGQILTELQRTGTPAIPVVHLSDPDELVDEAREHARRLGLGAAIRIGAEDLDDQIIPLDRAVGALAAQMMLSHGDIDLILDFGALADSAILAMSSRLARFVLPPLASQAWRTLTLASGAFPVNLSDVSAFTFGRLPRLDRELWTNLNALGLGRQLDFGDYAVTHPALQQGTAFAAPPQLRYTTATDWLVIKGRRTDRRGHAQFYDLCRELVSQHGGELAYPKSSWGDRYIHDAATGTARGPGNASIWRAIGTSQHIVGVVRRLASEGAP